ncbi:MAG TPA: dockerin type I domain-containing protein [Methanocorpusculum sp.]|nr:dockerin type I domain-containing protein [Methanocorpusculum sp.]
MDNNNRVIATDASKVSAHAKKTALLDSVSAYYADFDKDGRVIAADAAKISAYVRK